MAPPIGITYPSERNPDGSYNVRGVPIFAETEKRLGSKTVAFDRAWLEKAVANASRRAAGGYLAPLKIRHIGAIPAPTFAGKVWPKTLKRMLVDGQVVWAVFADYVEVPPGIFGLMVRGELPYVSIEAFKYDEHLIDAVALLDADTPHVPFPLFRAAPPASEVPAPTPASYTEAVNGPSLVHGSAVVASFSKDGHVAVLSRADAMAFGKPEDDEDDAPEGDEPAGAPDAPPAGDADANDDGGSDEDPPAGEQPEGAPPPVAGDPTTAGAPPAPSTGVDAIVDAILASPDFRSTVAAQVAALFANAAAGTAGGNGQNTPPPNGQPFDQGAPQEPATMSKPTNDPAPVLMSKDVAERLAAMQGEIDGLKSREAARQAERANEAAVDACIVRLAAFGKGPEHRADLLQIVATGGLKGLEIYEQAVKQHGTEAPGAIAAAAFSKAADGSAGTPDLPKEVLAYGDDRERLALAITCSKDYATLRRMGRLTEITLAEHLAAQIGAPKA